MSSFTMGFKQVRGPENRKDKRLPLPVFLVQIEDRQYQSINWSLGGFLLTPLDFPYFVGQDVVLTIFNKEKTSEIEVTAEILRTNEETNNFAVKFTEMNQRLYRFLENAFKSRFSNHD